MAVKRDYYEVLGVSRDASDEEIKRAFRKAAQRHHPDVDKSDGAEQRFKELNEAYRVLGDRQRRSAYDMFGHAGVDSASTAGGFDGFGGFGPFGDIFDAFFGGSTSSASGRRTRRPAGADLRYDLVHEAYGEFLAGIQAVPSSDRMLTLSAEYYSSYPTFDADTIYTVFAVTRYREALGRADWIVTPEWTLSGSYTRADYDGPTADVATLGVRNRSKTVKGLSVNASIDVRRGYPGDLTGFRLSADYAIGKKALLGAGVAYDSFQRDSMQDGFKAKKFWAGGSCEVRKGMAVKVRIEDAVTRLSSSEVQGRASVDFSF